MASTYRIIDNRLFQVTTTRTHAIIVHGDLMYLSEARCCSLVMMGRGIMPGSAMHPIFSGPLYKDVEDLYPIRPHLPEVAIMEWDGTIDVVRVLQGGNNSSLLQDEDLLQVRYGDGVVHTVPYWRLREMAINPCLIPLRREEEDDGSYW